MPGGAPDPRAMGSGPVPAGLAVDWIAVDWGTSNLRLWAIGPEGAVIAERASDRGMGKLSPDGFEPALLDLAGDLLPEGHQPPARPVDVVICGMAGARQGWAEAPYLTLPCRPDGTGAVRVRARDPRLSVRILPGLCQQLPADVMRGEETQIAGFLALEPDFEGTLCLPGTHCKWVQVRDGAVQHFRTSMTGEMFDLLSRQSVLHHGMPGAEAPADPQGEAQAFDTALAEVLAAPETLALSLFSIRPAGLLHGLPPAAARGRLSGLLVGAELAATRAFWDGAPVVVIGNDTLARRYCHALIRAGAAARTTDHPALALEGLRAARAALAQAEPAS